MMQQLYAWADAVTVPLWMILILGLGYCLVWWIVAGTRRARRRRPPYRDFDAWKRGR